MINSRLFGKRLLIGLFVILVLGAVVQQCEGEPEPPVATPVVQLVSRG